MKKIHAFLLAAALLLAACAGCSGQSGAAAPSASPASSVSSTSVPEPSGSPAPSGSAAQEKEPGAGEEDAGGKILIAYFTAAENSGVDAVASASFTMINDTAVGRLRAVADMIQSEAGGDLFSIQTATVYPTDGGELIDYAAEEQEQDARPELTSHIENFDQYEVVFVGFPTWWYDLPQALYSFFDEYDFSGKTIIPFNVHNGSRFSGTISTIQQLEPEATVIEDGFAVSERSVAEAQADVESWVRELGYGQ